VNAENNEGKTVLMAAAADGDVEMVEWLYRQGAKIDVRDAGGSTALHYACQMSNGGNLKAVQFL